LFYIIIKLKNVNIFDRKLEKFLITKVIEMRKALIGLLMAVNVIRSAQKTVAREEIRGQPELQQQLFANAESQESPVACTL